MIDTDIRGQTDGSLRHREFGKVQHHQAARINDIRCTLAVDKALATAEVARVVCRRCSEADEIEISLRHLQSDDVVLECGGGMGFVSTFCAHHLGGGEHVHVYEANPKPIGLIERTNRLNGVTTHVHNALLAHKAGTVDSHMSRHLWSSSTVPFERETRISMPVIDANQAIAVLRPTFLICDIEGGEVDLLPRLPLDSVQRICLEVHPDKAGEGAVAGLIAWLIGQGFVLDLASGPEVVFLHRLEV